MPETVEHEQTSPNSRKRSSESIRYERLGLHEANDRGVPFVMSVTSIGNDITLSDTQTVDIHEETIDESLKYSILELIRVTEESCQVDGFPEGGELARINRDVLKDAYPPIPGQPFTLDYNLSKLIYKSHINFLERYDKIYEHYTCVKEYRYNFLLMEDRHHDYYYNIWLHQMNESRNHNVGLLPFVRDTDSALCTYLERKLELCIPKTPLDAFIVANAYHAELYFYKTSENVILTKEMRSFKFVKRCFYNYRIIDKPRPIWIIVQDGSGCFYPVTQQINSSMFYLYQHHRLGSILLDKARCVDANCAGSILSSSSSSTSSSSRPAIVIDIDAEIADA